MKNCKDKEIRIYEVDSHQEDTHFEIFEKEEITKEYCLENFYYIDEDYNPNEEPSEWNRKYRQYDEFDFSADKDEEVFEFKGSYAEEDEMKRKAYDEDDYLAYCDDNNFEKETVDEYQEVYEYWDGSNWKKTFLGSTWEGEAPNYERREDLEEYSQRQIVSTHNGQGQGHEEYYEIFDKNDEHIMFVHLPVSYWQGDINNCFYEVSKEFIVEHHPEELEFVN